MHKLVPDLEGDFVAIEQISMPEPEAPDDVIVRIAGAGVCRSDLHLLTGEIPVAVPHVLGHENAGWVAAVGDAVTTVSPGDPVLCYPFLATGLSPAERSGLGSGTPEEATPGMDTPGGYAEYMRATERAMIRLPDGTDPAPLATLTDAGLAAYRACGKAATSLDDGAAAVVIGAGGLGHFAVQILRATTQARIVAVDNRQTARDLATRCGAHVSCAPDELREALGPSGAAAVLDFVGSDATTAGGLEVLAFGGHFLAVGVGGAVHTSTMDIVGGEKHIEGVFVGTYPELEELTGLVLEGKVTPHTVTYPLDEANRALKDLAAGAFVGRAVLVP
jgi:NAD+-dependent secondary alcohol dehydrogenase Adh1